MLDLQIPYLDIPLKPDILTLMQLSLTVLNKMAIDAALNSKWKDAISFNTEIVQRDSRNTDAKVRLGRAYLQIGDFFRAKKMFKEVLAIDPINPVALKNLKQANDKKIDHKIAPHIDPKSLIKEPGTTAETRVSITAKRMEADDFIAGEELFLKIDKRSTSLFKIRKDEKILIGKIENDLVNRLYSTKEQHATVCANFISGTGKDIKILIKSSIPVFKSEKQDVRPYIKKGSIEEPELELPEIEE